ncbi:MAG: adenosylcobinamide-GDP ribazoletransferase [Fimbriimonadaceae bacterium]|nr:adenosylcobinamide-GDP ribazoletransferase [Fimbriimonadaceae bacterium]
MNDLRRAISLLTRLPVRPDWDDPAPPGRAMAWYPAVGAGLGLLLWLLAGLLAPLGGQAAHWLRAALLLVCWVALTGGLHLDGWCDLCDALWVPADRAKRLAILQDPHTGAFALVGLALLFHVKLAALGALFHVKLGPALVAATTVARGVIVCAAAHYPLARPTGLAAQLGRGLGRREQVIAGLTTVAVGLLCGPAVWPALLVGLAAAWWLFRVALQRLGGLSGDVYGASVELVETTVLVAVALGI